jgi:hypothetical protein
MFTTPQDSNTTPQDHNIVTTTSYDSDNTTTRPQHHMIQTIPGALQISPRSHHKTTTQPKMRFYRFQKCTSMSPCQEEQDEWGGQGTKTADLDE